MTAAATSDRLLRFKLQAKSFPLIAATNRWVKARGLRTGLRRLNAHYAARAAADGIGYDEGAAWAEGRRRVAATRGGTPPLCGTSPRVLWVGANRDQDESGFLQALRRLTQVVEFRNFKNTYGQWFWDAHGHVRVFDPAIVDLNDKALLAQIDEALKAGPVDLLMGQMWANYISRDALAQVRARGIPVINVSMDDRLPDNWGSRGGTRLGAVGLATVSDLVLTTSSETCAWYAVEGCPAVFWPLASDPDVFRPRPAAQRDIDVLFIGNKYGIRESIVQALNGHGIQVTCYGAGWPNGPSTAEQSAELFGRARIVLGVGTVGHCHDVFTLKLRDFDAPMSGALYLTHRAPDLTRLYREGVEIECYADADEAARKIHHYLGHTDELFAVAAAGHAKAVSRDTWMRRLQDTLSAAGVVEPPAATARQTS